MLFTLLVFLLVLSVLVMVHELGHFIAAKKFGIKVEEFGFGLPPRLWGKKIGETIYSINWLPIGGFVKLYGEDTDETHSSQLTAHNKKRDVSRAFFHRPIWQRTIVLIAGVTMNFVLAVMLISYLFTQGVMTPTDRVHVERVLEHSPAQSAGLEKGDIIIHAVSHTEQRIEKAIKKGEDLIAFTRGHLGEEIVLRVRRGETLLELSMTPRKDFPSDEGPLGVVISNFEEKKYPIWEAPVAGMKESLKLSWGLAKGIGQTVWKLISFQPVAKDVAGPIGIAQMTGEAIKFGSNAVLELMGLLSLNLAIVNILPFPALDGGRLLFVLIEAATGKRVQAHFERYAHQIGMILLLMLILLVTVNDLVRIFGL